MTVHKLRAKSPYQLEKFVKKYSGWMRSVEHSTTHARFHFFPKDSLQSLCGQVIIGELRSTRVILGFDSLKPSQKPCTTCKNYLPSFMLTGLTAEMREKAKIPLKNIYDWNRHKAGSLQGQKIKHPDKTPLTLPTTIV